MKYFLLALLIAPQLLMAQLIDNFSDGNFTENPAWAGSDNQFIVNADSQLQLNSSGEDISYLSTPINTNDLTEWRIWTKLSFSPSDNNNARIYLVSDQPDITGSLNGFFLKLGESGSADALELYRQSGTTISLVCRGADGLLATSFTVNIRVLRSSDGMWEISADPTGGEDFQFQASGEDVTWSNYNYFGLLCKYTSSNATRFYFDNIYAGPTVVDNIKPELLSVEVTGTNQLSLTFSEAVSEISASNAENYSVNQGINNPLTAVRDFQFTSKVNLIFAQTIHSGIIYNLTVRDVEDLAGNPMEPATLPFSYYQVQSYDILINEIMADPEPAVGLPAFEYIELYNRSDFPVQLENWELSLGTTRKPLSRFLLESGAYLILTSEEAGPYFAASGNVMTFSSLSVVNTGTRLTLRDAEGAVIHSVSYSDNWYQDNIKMNGGWSLEQIDPSNPCGGASNWRASNNPLGGTPGTINSVDGQNPDQSAPEIERISILNESTVRVFFNESLDSTSIGNPLFYKVDNGIGNPLSVNLYPPDFRSVALTFSNLLTTGNIYTLTIDAGFTDCAGNSSTTLLSARFAIPAIIDSLDFVINEVLYDPRATGTDFVEIYNRSEKVLDLSNLWLATRDSYTGELESAKETVPEGRLVFPGEFILLTTNPQLVQSEYFSPAPHTFVEMSSLPSYANEAGTVVLITPSLRVIDEFTYNSDMQFALLNSTDGVSLERINYERPSNDAGNWHSASQNAGFATPGYQNSQYMATPETEDEISISPEIFSPDNDGFNDVLNIACNFSEPGYTATIRIFDSNGRQVRTLVKNEPAGVGNLFTWDGITDDHQKAPIGIYIIHIEIFNLGGKVKQFKKTAVLGGRL